MIAIQVLGHGWILVGHVRDDGRESGLIELGRPHVLRYWGTTKGLGELVAGPTEKTRVDPLPIDPHDRLLIPYRALQFALPVAEEPWSRLIGGAS